VWWECWSSLYIKGSGDGERTFSVMRDFVGCAVGGGGFVVDWVGCERSAPVMGAWVVVPDEDLVAGGAGVCAGVVAALDETDCLDFEVDLPDFLVEVGEDLVGFNADDVVMVGAS